MDDERLLRDGDELRRSGDVAGALAAYRRAAGQSEYASGELALRLARTSAEAGRPQDAVHFLRDVVDADSSFRVWQAAAKVLESLPAEVVRAASARSVRIAVANSYTTTQFVPMLRLAGLRANLAIAAYDGPYGQYQQDILDPESGLYAFEPDFVLLAVHEGELRLPELAEDPADAARREVDRWRGLWDRVRQQSDARVVQHLFAARPETPFGHLAARLPGSRLSLVHAVNSGLGEAAKNDVLVVDCERIASLLGKTRWFDDRYWHLSKQAVSLAALPLLALHTASVVAGDLGLGKKCLVLDLDNTLWGGVVGEDGLEGIQLGHGPVGEAYVAFQETILALKRRGIVLAVCSKNDEAEALGVFDRHPDMRIRLGDVAYVAANWENKAANIRVTAANLDLGLDALVYVDDNPAERELVRRELPEVDVLRLPEDPAAYARALSAYPFFETSSYNPEDARRAEQYRGRAEARKLQERTVDMETFLRDLEMRATVAPFDELHLPRIVQLLAKTNQFNLTTRRHGLAEVRALMADPEVVHAYLKLRDRFVDHGLVGLAIGRRDTETLDIDTLLLSCRVIGRTAERALLGALSEGALALGCRTLRGTYVPTAKNSLVKELYGSNGFSLVSEAGDGATAWEYPLALGPIGSDYILVEDLR